MEVIKARLMTKRTRTIITSDTAPIIDALNISPGRILIWKVKRLKAERLAVIQKLR